MINVGFIGLGGMGLYDASAFAKVRACRIVAGADPATAGQKKFAELYPHAKVYSDHRDLLADNSVDAVVIAVPTGHHARTSIDVLRSGRPVMCEKPMARTVAQCHRVNEVARKSRKVMMVAHCRRYDPDWGQIERIYRQGVLGKPVLWRSISAGRGPQNWFMDDKLGGGPLMDGAVHNYDFANLLFGDPQEVYASSIKLSKCTAIDTGTAMVHYKGGNQLLVSWSWAVPGSGADDILGPKGGLRFGPGPFADKVDRKGKSLFCFTDTNGKSKLFQRRLPPMAMYVNQAKHFLACIDGKAKCKSPGTESVKAVAVADAILKAGPRGGKRKVVW